jgi:Zn-dependent peptidase ImmA (M78 family)
LALLGGPSEEWLAVTDLATWRQQFQRAFAAELLCPAEALREHEEDLEREEFAAAADRFQVSEEVVRLQYENQIAPVTA